MHLGPHEMLEVKNNGAVIATDGTVTDTYNTHNIHLCKDQRGKDIASNMGLYAVGTILESM